MKLPSWSGLCLLKIHMEYVGRVTERDRGERERVCREEKMVYDLTERKRTVKKAYYCKYSFQFYPSAVKK